ncbi:MAG TPA: VOC family protein [Bryobacteraceae bacterium]|nr:VOC family protein [Bryobacteraceae bacterium]
MKVTPVLYMPELEPALEFWTTRLGFEVTVTVPEGEKLGFAILNHGSVEVMLQSHKSAGKDIPALEEFFHQAKACLFVEVDDFEETVGRIAGAPVAFPVRTTFYGMTEIGIFDPGGNLVVLAARTAPSQ